MNTTYTKLVTALNNAVSSGKVLDVSGLKADGTGSRKIDTPKTASGTKRWITGVPVVSDNYNTYLFAMQTLGQEYLPYAQQYRQLYGEGKIVRATKPQVDTRAATMFPMTPNMPQLVAVTPGMATVRSPRAARSPRAPKTPKAPKSPAVRQPAILQVNGTGTIRPISPPRIPRPASPPRIPRPASPNQMPWERHRQVIGRDGTFVQPLNPGNVLGDNGMQMGNMNPGMQMGNMNPGMQMGNMNPGMQMGNMNPGMMDQYRMMGTQNPAASPPRVGFTMPRPMEFARPASPTRTVPGMPVVRPASPRNIMLPAPM